jgi:hypothetical protein
MYLGRLIKYRIHLLKGDSELATSLHCGALYIFTRFPWAIFFYGTPSSLGGLLSKL